MKWPEIYCKIGPDVRVEAHKYFEVEAISHIYLLPNQEKKNYLGQPLTREYYCFEFKERSTGNFGSFLCGYDIAEHWLELSGQDAVPIFNPLSQHNRGGVNGGGPGPGAGGRVQNFDPIMKRLWNALSMYIALADITSSTNKAFGILRTLERNLENPPALMNIRAVNTLFYKALTLAGDPNYANYTDYVAYKTRTLGANLRVIQVNDFNQAITANVHKDPTKRFPPSF
jgi:hypothetical protein